MKNMLVEIRPAVVSTAVFAVVCCGFYPLAITGIAQLAFAKKANGSLLVDKSGTVQPDLGLFGMERVNVLKLNLALDTLTTERP
jgi:K+-transporting ATPase c subunit